MKINNLLTDKAILSEIGQRVVNRRIEFNLTQADAAKKAGISKSTVERIEGGASVQVLNIIRIFRVLDLMDNVDQLIPEPGPKPMDLLKQKRKIRIRASRKKTQAKAMGKTWKWKEDE